MLSSGFYGAGEDNRDRCTDSPTGRHPIWTISAPTSIFMPDAICVTTFPIYPGGLNKATISKQILNANTANIHDWESSKLCQQQSWLIPVSSKSAVNYLIWWWYWSSSSNTRLTALCLIYIILLLLLQSFNGLFSRTTQVSRHQKSRTILAKSISIYWSKRQEWQWHQLGDMLICTSLQTDNHASTPILSFFTGRMPFLPPNQQH